MDSRDIEWLKDSKGQIKTLVTGLGLNRDLKFRLREFTLGNPGSPGTFTDLNITGWTGLFWFLTDIDDTSPFGMADAVAFTVTTALEGKFTCPMATINFTSQRDIVYLVIWRTDSSPNQEIKIKKVRVMPSGQKTT